MDKVWSQYRFEYIWTRPEKSLHTLIKIEVKVIKRIG
jgi:hypothetical protein